MPPATGYVAGPAPADRLLSAGDGPHAITMMHRYDDRIVHSVVPVPDAGEVAGYPYEMPARIEEMDPAERHELLSAKNSPVWAHENPLD